LSAIERDFDCLAQFDEPAWTGNNHYHSFLLRHLPVDCADVLEIGCGKGTFSKALANRAHHVLAIDLSAEMIRVARSRSLQFPQIEFEVADVMTREFSPETFDCIATIATLHHLPTSVVLRKLKDALRPGGVLLVLDLLEPEKNLWRLRGQLDAFLNVVAMSASVTLRLLHNGRLRPPREVRQAWAEHGKTDRYLTMAEVRSLYAAIFPGVVIRKHLLWRYSAIWVKT
jgi:2-polyprenyl-3-methyl-5-hydroxy-6-metoxy-1,4-benzoquinol methylase